MGFHPKPEEVFNCLDEKTEALTQRGWVKGFDLKVGDKLLTKKSETGELVWESIMNMKKVPSYKGDLYEFRSSCFSAITTPNHRWLVTNRKNGWTGCVETEKLADGLGTYSIHRTGNYVAPTAKVYTDNFVELVGWLLTDGHISKPGKHKNFNVCQSRIGNPHKVAQIDRLFQRLNAKPRRDDLPNGQVVWALSGAASLTRVVCDLFPLRTLNLDFLLALTKTQLKLLLDTMMLGDGSSGSHNRFTCRDEDRADAFQMLCMLNNIPTTKRWRKPQKVRKQYKSMSNRPSSNGCWIITLLKRDMAQVLIHKKRYGKNSHPVNQVRKFKSYGTKGVWCPTVRNTYFVARREGDVYITGNSPIQSFVADVMNIRLIDICKRLPSSAKLIMQIHDAAVFEVDGDIDKDDKGKDAPIGDDAAQLWGMVKDMWSRPISVPESIVCRKACEIPLPIDLKVGRRWSDFG